MATKTIVRYRRSKPKTHHRRAGFTLPVAVIAGMAPIALHTMNGYKSGGIPGALNDLSAYTTGYVPADKQWKAAHLIEGMGPVVAGLLIHKFIGGKLGLNRMLANAGVPVVRI